MTREEEKEKKVNGGAIEVLTSEDRGDDKEMEFANNGDIEVLRKRTEQLAQQLVKEQEKSSYVASLLKEEQEKNKNLAAEVESLEEQLKLKTSELQRWEKKQSEKNDNTKADDLESQIEKLIYLYDKMNKDNGGEEEIPPLDTSPKSTSKARSTVVPSSNSEESTDVVKGESKTQDGKGQSMKDQNNETRKIEVTNKDDLFKYATLLPTNPAQYQCTLCGKTTRRRTNIWIHIESWHVVAGTFEHHCTECPKTMPTLTGLYTHMHVKHKKTSRKRRKGLLHLNRLHISDKREVKVEEAENGDISEVLIPNSGSRSEDKSEEVHEEETTTKTPRKESFTEKKIKKEESLTVEDNDNVSELRRKDVSTEEKLHDYWAKLLPSSSGNTTEINDIKSEEPGKITSRDQLYKYIELSETSPDVYKCSLCEKTSALKQNLWKHIENSHFPGSFSYPCKYCPLVLPSLIKQNSHTSKKHADFAKKRDGYQKYISSLIGTEYEEETKEQVRGRTRSQNATKLKPNVTEAHKSIFGTRRRTQRLLLLKKLKASKAIKTEQDTLYDDTLQEKEKVNERSQLKKYIRQSPTDLRSFICTLCDHSSKRKDNMWLHVESIHFPGTFSHQCNNCNLTFPTMSKLYVHMRDESKGKANQYATVQVSNTLELDKEDTDSHLSEKKTEDEKKSQTGDDVITTKDQLYKFIELKTTNPNGYSCTICGKCGHRKSHLWRHIESVHYPGIFEHTCKYCQSKFGTLARLTNHICTKHASLIKKRKKKVMSQMRSIIPSSGSSADNTMIAEKSRKGAEIRVGITDKITSEDELYKYIELVTENPRSYKCTLCGHPSTFRANLWIHVENIHFPGSFSHQCNQCDLTFPTKTRLSSHIVKTHNVHKRKKRRKRKGSKANA